MPRSMFFKIVHEVRDDRQYVTPVSLSGSLPRRLRRYQAPDVRDEDSGSQSVNGQLRGRDRVLQPPKALAASERHLDDGSSH